jgi:hypothetical protein
MINGKLIALRPGLTIIILKVTPDHRRLTVDLAEVWPDRFNGSWEEQERKGNKIDLLTIARSDRD